MKKIILIMVNFFMITSVCSQVLSKLPFNIIIGETVYEDLENFGVCKKEIKGSEHYFTCKEHEIANKFKILISENKIVTTIEFNTYYKHKLPSQIGVNSTYSLVMVI